MNEENIEKQENNPFIKEYTSDDISIASTLASGGFQINLNDDKLKAFKTIRDERNRYSENDIYNANESKKPLDIKEVQFEDGKKGLSIYFPSYDVNRSMATSYTSVNIVIPDKIDISSFKDNFISELTNKFYELDLFKPSEENRRRIRNMVQELCDFARQLFADKINQSTKKN